MLYGLYFTACAMGAPIGSIDCQNRVHWFSDEVRTPQACLVVAQAQLAEWIQTHERYRITGWRCGVPPRSASNRA